MSRDILLSLLEKKLSDFATAQSPALAVAFENRDFTPPQGASYLDPHLMLAQPRAAGVWSGGQIFQPGVYQVDVMGLPNTGRVAGVIASAVCREFKMGTQIVGTGLNAGTTITITEAYVPRSFNQDTRYKLPVSITFYAYMSPA